MIPALIITLSPDVAVAFGQAAEQAGIIGGCKSPQRTFNAQPGDPASSGQQKSGRSSVVPQSADETADARGIIGKSVEEVIQHIEATTTQLFRQGPLARGGLKPKLASELSND